MRLLLDISLIFLLGVISIQDFQARKISAILIPILGVGFILRSGLIEGYIYMFENSALNFWFIAVQLFILKIYFSLKAGRLTKIIDKFIGLGDVLFFIVLCFAFSPVNFFVFYIFSLFATILIHIGIKALRIEQNKEIPLAGILAGLLVFVIIANNLFPSIPITNDNLLLAISTQ